MSLFYLEEYRVMPNGVLRVVSSQYLPVRHCRQAARTYADMQESVRRSCAAGGVAVFVDGEPVAAEIVGGRLITQPSRDPDVAAST